MWRFSWWRRQTDVPWDTKPIALPLAHSSGVISLLNLHEPSCNGKIIALYGYYYFIVTIFGFFQDFYIGMEQRTGNHLVQVGYQKGAIQVKWNLVFNVHDSPGTASELIDYQMAIVLVVTVIIKIMFSKRRLHSHIIHLMHLIMWHYTSMSTTLLKRWMKHWPLVLLQSMG